MADEYIRREDAIDYIEGFVTMNKYYHPHSKRTTIPVAEAIARINETPSADVQPVRRGKWIEKPAYEEDKEMGFDIQIVCSECDQQNSRLILNEYYEPIEKMFISSLFCPNCGADMRGGTDG